jgi:hypothetical protein
VSKTRVALFAAVCAAAFTTAPFLGAVDAKKKTKSLVGKYKGITEEGGKVSFRITGRGKVVGFTLTKAKLYCLGPHRGSKIPTREPEFTKVLPKITHGPMRLKNRKRKYPLGKEWKVADPFNENVARQTGVFTGKVADLVSGPTSVVLPDKAFHGEVEFETANGPTPFPTAARPIPPEWAPGTEWCVTKLIDWDAKKPGTPGSLPSY